MTIYKGIMDSIYNLKKCFAINIRSKPVKQGWTGVKKAYTSGERIYIIVYGLYAVFKTNSDEERK